MLAYKQMNTALTVSGTGGLVKGGLGLVGKAALKQGIVKGGEAAITGTTNTSRVFWSGGEVAKNAAENFAIKNGSTTLEMTEKGIYLTNKTKGMAWEEAKSLWDDASRQFAQGAKGEVNVFQRADVGVKTESVWARVEYPKLINNANITKINYHVIMKDGSTLIH